MLKICILFVYFLGCIWADTPANCTYDDILGTWTILEGDRNHDRTIPCESVSPLRKFKVNLRFPDVAVDEYGNEGFWTLIYNQGFEIVINDRKYFAFSKYSQVGENVTSYCDQTLPGWSHDVLGHNWACYSGLKAESVGPKKHVVNIKTYDTTPYRINVEMISEINYVQKSWKAGIYPEYGSMTIDDILRRSGGRSSRMFSLPSPAPVTKEVQKQADELPLEWDWRNVDGVSYVSPVRNQESCGSCYAFSSVGMVEARLRVLTNNSQNVELSPQDVVECSEYSQGCEGGFPYLVAGKYAQDFGMVVEECNPYMGFDDKCHTNQTCYRHYTTEYEYVGGFYGGCNEELMKIQLVKNGPMSVSFEVYSDFQHYTGGIYHHTGVVDKFNPFEITNHAVLLVGYGYDHETLEKFWIVKNSWGESWGERGYFRIRRGTDECSMESIAVETFPIP